MPTTSTTITQKARITMRSWRDGAWKRLCPKNTKPKSESSEVELRRAVEINSCLETWCAGAVVAALVFEAIVLWWYANPKKWHEAAGLILCDALLAVAIGWEIVFGRRANNAQSDLQAISDQKVAASSERAAEANRKAEESRERAAEANQKAEEARLETERVRLETERVRFEFAKYREDRKLDAEQIERIAAKLREFPGTEYVGGVAFQKPEIMHLMESIEYALLRAKWSQINCPDGHQLFLRRSQKFICDGVDAENVRIRLLAGSQSHPDSAAAIRHSEEWAALESAGRALATALMAEDVEATFDATRVALVGAPPRTRLNVMIGPKK